MFIIANGVYTERSILKIGSLRPVEVLDIHDSAVVLQSSILNPIKGRQRISRCNPFCIQLGNQLWLIVPNDQAIIFISVIHDSHIANCIIKGNILLSGGPVANTKMPRRNKILHMLFNTPSLSF